MNREDKPSYNLNKPEIISLPEEVSEISGISYEASSSGVFAVDDESEFLFQFPLQQKPALQKWSLGKKKDYEGVVVHDKKVFVLESDGDIIFFPLSFPIANTKTARFSEKGKNEFESFFKEPAGNRLLTICKDCKEDGKDQVSVYAFDPQKGEWLPDRTGTIKKADIESFLKEKISRFKPSAADVHPQSGDIYIVSSINKLLVVTDKQFAVKEVHKLDPALFKQPEGLAFTNSGDLLISNEAAGQGAANLLVFRHQPR